jgi:hypothetical protein
MSQLSSSNGDQPKRKSDVGDASNWTRLKRIRGTGALPTVLENKTDVTNPPARVPNAVINGQRINEFGTSRTRRSTSTWTDFKAFSASYRAPNDVTFDSMTAKIIDLVNANPPPVPVTTPETLNTFFGKLETILTSYTTPSTVLLSIYNSISEYYSRTPFSFTGSIYGFSSNIVTNAQMQALPSGSGMLIPQFTPITIGDSTYQVENVVGARLIKTTIIGGAVTYFSRNSSVTTTGLTPNITFTYLGSACPGLCHITNGSSLSMTASYDSQTNTLSYTAVPGDTFYRIYYANGSYSTPRIIGTGTTSVLIESLGSLPYAVYDIPLDYFVVGYVLGQNISISSNRVSIVIRSPVNNVFSSNITKNSVSLTWDPTTSTVSGDNLIGYGIWDVFRRPKVFIADVSSSTTTYTATGLSSSTRYELQVRPKYQSGYGAIGNSSTARITTLVDIIPTIVATYDPATRTVSWITNDAPPGRLYYTILDSVSGEFLKMGGEISLSSPQILSYILPIPLRPSPKTIAAYVSLNTDSGSFFSNIFTVFYGEKVTGLVSSNLTSTSVNLEWTAVSGATSYILYQNGDEIADPVGNNYNVTSLSSGEDYAFSVKAVYPGGDGEISDDLNITTPEIPFPAKVTGLVSSNLTSTSVELTWDSVLDATSYVVYNGTDQIATPTGTTYTVTSLSEDTDYIFTVKARNSRGNGPASDDLNITTPVQLPLAVPENLRITDVYQNTIEYAWDPVAEATSYNAWYVDNDFNNVLNAQYASTGLSPNTQYTFRVQSRQDDVPIIGQFRDSLISSPISRYTLAEVPVISFVDNGTLIIEWDNINAKNFAIMDGDTLIESIDGTLTSYDLSNASLTYGLHNITVKAYNGDDVPSTSNILEIFFGPKVTGLIASNKTSTTVDLSWNAITGAGDYIVFQDGNGVAIVPDNTYTVTSLTPGTTYIFTVRATLPEGNGRLSDGLSVTPESTLLPPANLRITFRIMDNLTYEWDPVPEAVGYNIYYGITDDTIGVTTLGNVTTLSLSVPVNTQRTVSVSTIGDGGQESARSATLSRYTLPVPANLRITSTTSSRIVYEWDPVAEAIGYELNYGVTNDNGDITGTMGNVTTITFNLSPNSQSTVSVSTIGAGNTASARSATVSGYSLGLDDLTDMNNRIATLKSANPAPVPVSTPELVDTFFGLLESILGEYIPSTVLLSSNSPTDPISEYYSRSPFNFTGEIYGFSGLVLTNAQMQAIPGNAGFLIPQFNTLTIGDSKYQVENVAGARLMKTPISGGAVTYFSRDSSVTTTGLTPEVTFTYLGSGSSGLCRKQNIVPVPAQVTGLASSNKTDTTVQLNWTAVLDATSYVIYKGTVNNPSGEQIGTSNTNSYSATALFANNTYIFSVKGRNLGGNGPASAGLTVTTDPPPDPNIPPPDQVTGLDSSNITDISVDLSWTAVVGATSYIIYKDSVVDGISGTTTYSPTSLDGSTTYIFTVKARNAGGEGPASDGVSVTTQPTTPAKVTGLTTGFLDGSQQSVLNAITDSSINLIWNLNRGATSYIIYQGGTQIGTPGGNSYSVGGLTDNTEYVFSVKAVYPAGEGEMSDDLGVRTRGKPVSNFRITNVALPDISYEFDAPVNPTGGAPRDYDILLRRLGGSSSIDITNTTTTTSGTITLPPITITEPDGTITTLPPDYYKDLILIVGANYGGVTTGFYSSPLIYKEIPSKITGLVASNITATSVDLQWSQFTLASQPLDDYGRPWGWKYIVYQGTAEIAHVGLDTNTYSVTSLDPGTVYNFSVKVDYTFMIIGLDIELFGQLSDELTVTTSTPTITATYDIVSRELTWITDGLPSGTIAYYLGDEDSTNVLGEDITSPFIISETLAPEFGSAPKTVTASVRIMVNGSVFKSNTFDVFFGVKVTNLVASNVTSTTAEITWDAVPDAIGYIIYKDGVEFGTTISTENVYSLTSLTPESTYIIAVKAIYGLPGSGIRAPTSDDLMITTPVPDNLDFPTGLRITDVSLYSISYAWDSVAEATGYNAWYSDSSSDPLTNTSYISTSLVPNTQYSFKVSSSKEDPPGTFIESLKSPPITAYTLADVLNIGFSGADGKSITWGYSNATQIGIMDGDTQIDLIDGTLSSYDFSLDTNFIGTRLVTVKAYNGDNVPSGPSNVINIFLGPKVEGLMATNITSTTVNLSWIFVSGAADYTVYQNGNEIAISTTTSYNVTLLTPEETYTFSVKARFPEGYGRVSNGLDVITTAPENLDFPTGLRITDVYQNSIEYAWDSVAEATGYNAWFIDDDFNPVSNTSYASTGLSPNTQHTFRVQSIKETAPGTFIESLKSPPITAYTLAEAPVISLVAGTMFIQWDIINAKNFGIMDGDTQIDLIDGTLKSYDLSNASLTYGLHNITVKAYNGDDVPSTSNILEIFFGPKVDGLMATNITSTTVDLSWNAVPGAGDYAIFQDGNGLTFVTENTYTVTSLTPGTTYIFTVRATLLEGNGRLSDELTVTTTGGELLPPQNVRVTDVTINSISYAWDSVSGADAYDVEDENGISVNSANTSYERINLYPNTPYTIVVRSKKDGLPSANSLSVVRSTLTEVPDVSSTGDTSIGWNPVIANKFKIYIDNVLFVEIPDGSTRDWDFASNPPPNGLKTITVTSVNLDDVESAKSVAIQKRFGPYYAPVTSHSVTSSNMALPSISWEIPELGTASIDAYIVEASISGTTNTFSQQTNNTYVTMTTIYGSDGDELYGTITVIYGGYFSEPYSFNFTLSQQ